MRITLLGAAIALMAIAPGRVEAQTPRPVSATLGTPDLMPQLGKQKLSAPPGLKPTDSIDAEIVVAVTGGIVHSRILKSTDATGELDRACIEAMKKWTLTPARTRSGEIRATLVGIRFKAVPAADGNTSILEVMLYDIVAIPPPPMAAPTAAAPIEEPKKNGVTWPKVIREITAAYTQDAMRHKLQGSVELEIVVLPDGTVGAARVVKGLEFGLTESALAAAHYWLFEPGRKDGVPVATKVGLVLEYRLH